MDPLGKVDNIIRERELAVQGIYTWLPEFLVRLRLVAVSNLVFCWLVEVF